MDWRRILSTARIVLNCHYLLLTHNAKLSFAQDFLNAKLIGHSFELEGRVDIVDTRNTFIEIELEGFYLRFTLEIIMQSLVDFRNNFAAKKVRKYFPYLDKIIATLKVSAGLMQLQHYLVDIKQYLNKISVALNNDPLILPISFGGHAITLIKFQDWLIRCDRGEFGKNNGSVIYYDIQHQPRLTKSLCRDLLYKRQYPEFINNGLVDYLGLKPQHILPVPIQKTGNCSWANVEAIIPALMFPLLLNNQNNSNQQSCEHEALEFYHEWREWNKTRSLELCVQSIKEADKSRQISKVALLAAILFQSCDHENSVDRQRAKKILAVLSQSDYLPVLQCYAKTFAREKDYALWKNFCSYLEDFGIDSSELPKEKITS